MSIRERPAEAEDPAVPVHWQGAMCGGRGLTEIAIVFERSTRFTVLVQLDGRDRIARTSTGGTDA